MQGAIIQSFDCTVLFLHKVSLEYTKLIYMNYQINPVEENIEVEQPKIINTASKDNEVHAGGACRRPGCNCPGYKHDGTVYGDCANCGHRASEH